jgi:hypothetical protein
MNREVLRQSISFQLNPDSGVPAYLQLAQQVKQPSGWGYWMLETSCRR